MKLRTTLSKTLEESRKLGQVDLKEMEETFREPNLLIESICDMQQKQEKKVSTIRSKLNEME